MIVTDLSRLTSECKDVSLFEADDILKKLDEELSKSASGVGLAANQIGIDAKVCIVKYRRLIQLVNPVIIELNGLREFHSEGCLSFPGEFITTKRYDEVFVKDLLYPDGRIFLGFEAVAVQHEIGHLYGEVMHNYQIPKLKPNDKCWCGSGTKYKKCHSGLTVGIE